jgi:hypothetical protein
MRKFAHRLFLLLALVQAPVMAQAAEQPVTVSHELTSTFQGADSLTLNYTLHLVNTGESGITDLNLSLVTLPPFTTRDLVLKLAFLGAGENADLEAELLAGQEPDVDAMALAQMTFSIKGTDDEGRQVSFRVTSFPTLMGGVRQ